MKSIQDWKLVPYQSWGPLNLSQEIETWDLEDIFGPHIKEEVGPQTSELIRVYQTAQGPIQGCFTNSMSFRYLRLPEKFVLSLSQAKSAVKSEEKFFSQTMKPLDPQYNKAEWYDGDHLIAPNFGISLYQKTKQICIFSEFQKDQLFPYKELKIKNVSPAEFKKALAAIRKKFPISTLQAFLAQVSKTERSQAHWGGAPLLKKDEEWPICQCCKSPMALILQLPTINLPKTAQKSIQGTGILQLFHCPKENCINLMGDESEQGEYAWLCRLESATKLKPIDLAMEKKMKGAILKPRYITDWKRTVDGPTLSDLASAKDTKIREWSQSLAFQERYDKVYPLDEDKFGGSPRWLQDSQVHDCPFCQAGKRKPLKFVLQFASQNRAKSGFAFGDRGQAYLFQCTVDPKHFSFLMQSS